MKNKIPYRYAISRHETRRGERQGMRFFVDMDHLVRTVVFNGADHEDAGVERSSLIFIF